MISTGSSACTLTDEYKSAREEISKWSRYEYQECITSVNDFYYWQEVSKCKIEGRGKNIGGGCQHVAGYTQSKVPESAYEHCQPLKVIADEYEEALESYVKAEKIDKCLEPQSTP